jgi:hypothetical protein
MAGGTTSSFTSDLDAVEHIPLNDCTPTHFSLSDSLWSDVSGAITDPEGVEENSRFFPDSRPDVDDLLIPPAENEILKQDCNGELSEFSASDVSWSENVIRSELSSNSGYNQIQWHEQMLSIPNYDGLENGENSPLIESSDAGKHFSDRNFDCSSMPPPQDFQSNHASWMQIPNNMQQASLGIANSTVEHGSLETSRKLTDFVRSDAVRDPSALEHPGPEITRTKARPRHPISGNAALKDFFLKNLEDPYPTHAQKLELASQHGITLRMVNK